MARRPSSGGIPPVKEKLSTSCSTSQIGELPQFPEGSAPFNVVFHKRSSSRLESCPSAGGIPPVNGFPERSKCVRLVNRPSSGRDLARPTRFLAEVQVLERLGQPSQFRGDPAGQLVLPEVQDSRDWTTVPVPRGSRRSTGFRKGPDLRGLVSCPSSGGISPCQLVPSQHLDCYSPGPDFLRFFSCPN